eukprot:scaffold50658_cov63-Phaeocystis_antarctica.AAC.3
MAPKKRARTATAGSSASSSSQPAAAAPKLTLRGGVPHHPSLAGLWRDERLTDFALCAEGVEFKAHRVALASSSKYFLNLFESGMRDATDATHSLEGIRPKALEALLAFIYEGKCEIDEGLLTEVLEASARLVVDTLKEACANAIGARLAPSNALNMWRLADTFTLPALEKAAVEAALLGFEELPAQLATSAEVVALVQEDRLAKSEEAVFLWIKRWWEGGERPEAELLAVMKHVRFAVMAAGFLHGTVKAWPALRSVEARSMLLNATLHAADGTKVVPRSGFGPGLIYIVGGQANFGKGRLSKVELYNPQATSWTQLASMTSSRFSFGCVALDGKLYAVGGRTDTSQSLDTAEVYDPQTNGWQPLAKMSTGRFGFGLAAVGGKIYAIGGWNNGALESVEAYDPQLGTWALVASMSGTRQFNTAVVLHGKIYVMGGKGDGDAILDTVEVYDPQADSWQRVASTPPRALYAHGAAAMGGKIYVTGGIDLAQEGDSSSVCVYDPHADAWTQLAKHGQRSAGSRLRSGGRQALRSRRDRRQRVSWLGGGLDPASDSWAPVSNLMKPARYSMVAVAL